MTKSALNHPITDPTRIFEHFRGNHGTQLLVAAVAHFNVFGRLNQQSMTFDDLRADLNLESRPANVLVTALRAMELLSLHDGVLRLTDLAREHLVPGCDFDVGDYVGLAASSPDVLTMVELLKTNKPLGSDDDGGSAFIYRDGIKSAMEAEESARHLTLALSGRAKNVAPTLADTVDLSQATRLLDVGGGTGIYAYALLQKKPQLQAIVFDRPEVLKVAREMGEEYGVLDRMELVAGDMFSDQLPTDCDAILLSNILHDWDVPECISLVSKCAGAVKPGGSVIIHDVFLDDDLGGPLPIAFYSASLFSLTEGRAYSAAEFQSWLKAANLSPSPIMPTLIHCGALTGKRNST